MPEPTHGTADPARDLSGLQPGDASGARSGARIVVRGLTRRFGETVALAPIDLDVGGLPGDKGGTITGLIGPNGSGKSTLLRVLTGLVRPDAGSAVVDGAELAGDGLAIRKRVTYAPGELHLYTEMRAGEHLAWFLRGRPDRRLVLERARAIAALFELPLQRRVRAFSHGMKRQLVLAAALAPDVRVRILDEPTEGLDPTRRNRVVDLLRQDAERGVTILLSSHHFGEIDRLCDRLIFLSHGQKLAEETAQDVAARTRRFVRILWPSEADAVAAKPELERVGAESVTRRSATTNARLPTADPRPFLRALADVGGLPPPREVEFGRMSLAEIYSELYGVEGV
jgi:ABC-2 type transport system ATP-binding protein